MGVRGGGLGTAGEWRQGDKEIAADLLVSLSQFSCPLLSARPGQPRRQRSARQLACLTATRLDLDFAGGQQPLADKQAHWQANQIGVVELDAGGFLAIVVQHLMPSRL